MSLNKTQIAVIAGSLLLIVLLLFANTSLPPKAKSNSSEHAGNTGARAPEITELVQHAVDALPKDQKLTMQKLDEATRTSQDKKTAFENIIDMWDSLRQPAAAAYYMEQASKVSGTEQNWQEAGNRYYAATQFAAEQERPVLYNKAMECFENTLKLNPKNVDAKISLASCYVEGSQDPMKGIGMLREVEKTDSNNVNLQLNFAFFSEKSGQWDRAIARFEKVLKIQPDFIEAYLHMADAYEAKGDKAKAIESLEKFMKLTNDITAKTEIQDYINKLKNS
jgi:tetratricopeptide (TPR) repeat protein